MKDILLIHIFASDASDVYARVNITTDKNLTENDIKNIIVKNM